jgi:hypothetical protein
VGMSKLTEATPAVAPNRESARSEGSPRLRGIAAAVAFLVALAGFGLVLAAFRGGGGPTPAATVENGRIAFASFEKSDWQIFTVNPDGTDITKLTDLSTNQFHPAWSPDGARIAFDAQHEGGLTEIDVIDADGWNIESLTEGPGWNYLPAWSPDGREIVFVSNRDGNDEIYVMNADGSGQTRLTDDPEEDLVPDWSPDGSRIAFQSNRSANNEIYVMNSDGSGVTNLTDAPTSGDFDPAWSPDGGRITFVSDRDGNPEIYVMNSDGSHVTRLTDAPSHNWSPAWSPDGSKIAFESDRNGPVGVYVMHRDGTGVSKLIDTSREACCPAWQPQPVEGASPTPTPSVTAPPDTPSAAPSFIPQLGTTVPVGPNGQTNAILYAAGSVWVTAYGVDGGDGVDRSMLFRLDPATSRVIDSIPLTGAPTWTTGGGGVAFGDDSVWIVGTTQGPQAILQRVDPQTDQVVATIPLGSEDIGLDVSVNTSGVWVAIGLSSGQPAEVVRVDPSTNQIDARIALQADYVRHIVAADGGVLAEEFEWSGNEGPCGFITAIDPATNAIITRVPVGTTCSTSRLWVWNEEIWATVDSGFVRMDPRTGEPTGPATPYPRIYGLRGFVASAGDLIWWSEYPGGNGVRPDDLASFDPVAGVMQEYNVKTTGIAAAASVDAIWC